MNERKGKGGGGRLPEKNLRLGEAGEFHLHGKHVGFKILNVVRKNRSVEFRDGEIIAQEVATIRHTIQEIRRKTDKKVPMWIGTGNLFW